MTAEAAHTIANPAAIEILNYLRNADQAQRRRFVDFMTHDADLPLAERNELRALYDLPAMEEDDEDLPTLIAQWDEEEAALAP